MTRPSIVITGRGLATCLGLSPRATFERIARGECGVGPMAGLEQRPREEKGGGQAVELPVAEAASNPPERAKDETRRAARYLRYVIAEALREAGVHPEPASGVPSRRGIVLGTTLHGMRAGGNHLRSGNPADLRHFLAGDVLNDATRGLPLDFFRATTSSACSSGLGSIALAVTMLEQGELDLAVAGGYDSVSEYSYGGFDSLRLIARGPLRPFAKDREGMKVAEGYAVLVLERKRDAAARGAHVLARVAGFGESADAHHLTQPKPDGSGAARAILSALSRAGISPGEIDLIAAHATATPGNDAAEHEALKLAFGPSLPSVPVTAFKSHVGHTLGGAGAVELVLSLEAMRRDVAPPVANVTKDAIEFAGLDVVTETAREKDIRRTANLSLGFGGANTCVVLERADQPIRLTDSGAGTVRHEAVVTGIGVLLPGVIGIDAFRAFLRGERTAKTGAIGEEEYASLLSARRVRRMSEYVKLTLAAAGAAIADAGITDAAPFAESACAILGTTHGSTGYCEQYYTQIVKEGMEAANPLLFAEGVPNAGAAQLSLMLGIKGGCQTIIGTRSAGLDALMLARLRIRGGDCERVFVSAAEEYSPMVERMYAACGGGPHSAAAVAFVVESRQSAQRRGAKVVGALESVPLPGSVPLLAASSPRSSDGRANPPLLPPKSAEHSHAQGDVFSVAPLLSVLARLLSIPNGLIAQTLP